MSYNWNGFFLASQWEVWGCRSVSALFTLHCRCLATAVDGQCHVVARIYKRGQTVLLVCSALWMLWLFAVGLALKQRLPYHSRSPYIKVMYSLVCLFFCLCIKGLLTQTLVCMFSNCSHPQLLTIGGSAYYVISLLLFFCFSCCCRTLFGFVIWKEAQWI